MNFKCFAIGRIAMGLFLAGVAFSSAFADSVSWTAQTGGWNDVNNWSGALPQLSGSAYVDNGGTVSIKTGVSGTAGFLYVGGNGKGALSISGGGGLFDAVCTLGYSAGASGAAVITSGTWRNTTALTVGHSGTGTLNIQNGLVIDGESTIGYLAGSSGSASVTTGTWVHNGDFVVGGYGKGSLTVNSGFVTNASGYIGYMPGSTGSVAVTGGTWNNTGQLLIGGGLGPGGTGALTIWGTGVVSASHVLMGDGSTLNLGSGGGAGTLDADNVIAQSGTATLNFNHNGNYTFSSQFQGSLNVNHIGSGTTTLTADNMLSGSATVSVGELKVNGTLQNVGSRFIQVAPGATLSGTGTVYGGVQVDGALRGGLFTNWVTGSGVIAPGGAAGAGILKIEQIDPTGGLDFAFTFSLANTNPIYNNAAASGNSILLGGVPGFTSALNEQNTISIYLDQANLGDTYLGGFFLSMSAEALDALIKDADFAYYIKDLNGSVTFNGVKYSRLDDALVALSTVSVTDATFNNGPSQGSELKVVVVPEPGTWVLSAAGFGTLLSLVARRHRTV